MRMIAYWYIFFDPATVSVFRHQEKGILLCSELFHMTDEYRFHCQYSFNIDADLID